VFHVNIDTQAHRQILGYETGTRLAFDETRAGDSLWVFVDRDKIENKIRMSDFLAHPQWFTVDDYGNVRKRPEPPIVEIITPPQVPLGRVALKGRDGRYLRGADGAYILGYATGYTPPPEGHVYVTDGGPVLLTDNGVFITEPL
jgi:hypothetical protein